MKNLTNKIAAVFVAVLMICVTVVPAFADETTQAETSKQVKAGSTVEYTLSIADSYQNISGFHFEFYFDNSVMQVKDVNVDNLYGPTVNANENNDGRIIVLHGLVNGSRGLACLEKTDLITVTFEVVADGDATVEYYIPYMYDFNNINLVNYTLTETFKVDNSVITQDKAPELADTEELTKYEGFDKGDFENHESGKASDPDAKKYATTQTEANGKIFEYVFYAEQINQAVSAIQLEFYYDTQQLKLIDVKSDVLKGANINFDKDNVGKIVVVRDFDDASEAPVFADKTKLVVIKFEVLKEAEDYNITYNFTELLGTDNKKIENIKLTEDRVLDGKVIAKGETAEQHTDKPDFNLGLVIGLVAGGLIVAAIVVIVFVKIKQGKSDESIETVDLDKL